MLGVSRRFWEGSSSGYSFVSETIVREGIRKSRVDYSVQSDAPTIKINYSFVDRGVISDFQPR